MQMQQLKESKLNDMQYHAMLSEKKHYGYQGAIVEKDCDLTLASPSLYWPTSRNMELTHCPIYIGTANCRHCSLRFS